MKSPLILAAVAALVGGFLFGGAVGVIQQMRIESIRADHLATPQQYAQAAADAERTTANRLRAEVARISQSARDTAVASGGATGTDTIGLLAELFARADETAGELARYGDDARIRGLACERAYEQMRAK